MATPFTALGGGNGFSSCLDTLGVVEDDVLLNAPSLAQTMSAYWNIQSVSYGGANFNPGNQPFDLICNKNANSGSNSDGNASDEDGRFSVSITLPRIFFINGEKYYKHGISMSFSASNDETLLPSGQQESTISVQYLSSLYTPQDNVNYNCEKVEFGPPGEEFDIGRVASERKQTVSSVTISGIPFIKIVTKTFGGENFVLQGGDPLPPCPEPDYPSLPPLGPILNLHTY